LPRACSRLSAQVDGTAGEGSPDPRKLTHINTPTKWSPAGEHRVVTFRIAITAAVMAFIIVLAAEAMIAP